MKFKQNKIHKPILILMNNNKFLRLVKKKILIVIVKIKNKYYKKN